MLTANMLSWGLPLGFGVAYLGVIVFSLIKWHSTTRAARHEQPPIEQAISDIEADFAARAFARRHSIRTLLVLADRVSVGIYWRGCAPLDMAALIAWPALNERQEDAF